jgi:hypothetical protein
MAEWIGMASADRPGQGEKGHKSHVETVPAPAPTHLPPSTGIVGGHVLDIDVGH